jgi:hypothetical protein
MLATPRWSSSTSTRSSVPTASNITRTAKSGRARRRSVDDRPTDGIRDRRDDPGLDHAQRAERERHAAELPSLPTPELADHRSERSSAETWCRARSASTERVCGPAATSTIAPPDRTLGRLRASAKFEHRHIPVRVDGGDEILRSGRAERRGTHSAVSHARPAARS